MQNNCSFVYPRNMVCFRYTIVNNLHKGDNKYNHNSLKILYNNRR